MLNAGLCAAQDVEQLQSRYQEVRKSVASAEKRAEGLQGELSSVLGQLRVCFNALSVLLTPQLVLMVGGRMVMPCWGQHCTEPLAMSDMVLIRDMHLQAVQSSAAEEIQQLREQLRAQGGAERSTSMLASQTRSAGPLCGNQCMC